MHQDLCGRQGAGDSSPVCTVLTAADTSICGGLCRGEMKISNTGDRFPEHLDASVSHVTTGH